MKPQPSMKPRPSMIKNKNQIILSIKFQSMKAVNQLKQKPVEKKSKDCLKVFERLAEGLFFNLIDM